MKASRKICCRHGYGESRKPFYPYMVIDFNELKLFRFVKGVVDSEDLPLSLSREKPQDSRLLARINDVLTRKLLRFLDDELRKNRKSYQNFYAEFSVRRSENTYR